MKQYGAEFFGTFWLVLGGCGSAVLAAGVPELGIGYLGVALAFGLSVLTMAYAIGPISGAHLNPAVSVGLWVGGRFPASQLLPYIVAQVLGGLAAGGVLYLIASGKEIPADALARAQDMLASGQELPRELTRELGLRGVSGGDHRALALGLLLRHHLLEALVALEQELRVVDAHFRLVVDHHHTYTHTHASATTEVQNTT